MSDYEFGAIGFGLIAGLVLLMIGWRRRRIYNQLAGSDVIDVAQIDDTGTVALEGTVTDVEAPLAAPFTDRVAAVVAWLVDEYTPGGDSNSVQWETHGQGVETSRFQLDDGTGAVDVDIGTHVELRFGGTNARTGVHADDVLAEFDTFPVEEKANNDDRPDAVREFENRVWPNAGPSTEKRRFSEQVIQSGDDVYVLGTATAPEGVASPLSPEDVTITARDSDLTAVSNQDGETVRAKFSRNSGLMLAGSAISFAIAIAGVVALLLGS